jgi:hypothetical protein
MFGGLPRQASSNETNFTKKNLKEKHHGVSRSERNQEYVSFLIFYAEIDPKNV